MKETNKRKTVVLDFKIKKMKALKILISLVSLQIMLFCILFSYCTDAYAEYDGEQIKNSNVYFKTQLICPADQTDYFEIRFFGKGEIPDYEYGEVIPWKEFDHMEIRVVIDGEITAIGNNAFNGFTNITDVTISKSVKSIGEEAFANCKNLQKITMAEGVENIGDSAFLNCSDLKDVVIPNTVKNIGTYAFGILSRCAHLFFCSSV